MPPLVSGDCDFYSQCIEEVKTCGLDGYAIGYGERYCERFNSRDNFSPNGRRWRDATLVCLQEELVQTSVDLLSDNDISCEGITDLAFDSHPYCYTQPGYSVCSLGIRDLLIIKRVIDTKDFLSRRGLRQLASVANTCLFGIRMESFAKERSFRSLQAESDIQQRIIFWQDLLNETHEIAM